MSRTALTVVCAALIGVPAVGAVSNFDTGDEGWRITGDAQGGSVLPTYEATGGNPGGYIEATDDVQGGTWYFQAPDTFHGDFSAAYGADLTYDLRQSRTSNQFNNVEVYLRGGGLELQWDVGSGSHPGTDWTPYAITLDENGGWMLASTNAAPTAGEFQQVLGDVTDLQIRGEYVSGSDTGGLDNVVLVPEPTAVALLGVMLVPVLSRGRRW